MTSKWWRNRSFLFMDQTINRLTKWGLLAGLVLVAWMLIEAIQRPGPEPRQTEVVVETCDHGSNFGQEPG